VDAAIAWHYPDLAALAGFRTGRRTAAEPRRPPSEKGVATMYRVPGVLSAATASPASPAPAVPKVRPASRPPSDGRPAPEDSRAAAPAEAIPGQNDMVIRRLLTAGQDLQTALGLMGDHLAKAKIRHAADELDQVIRAIQVGP
jgi:hypothetical protein